MLTRIALLCCFGFSVGAAAPPLIDYVTYLGGSYSEGVVGVAVDSTGAAYVAGGTTSPDFPVTSTTLGTPTTNACTFITKFNSSVTAIDFSICLANFSATAFALDANGNMYLGTGNALVKLDPTGQNILYNTPLGGSAESIAVDALGNVYAAGAAAPGAATTAGVYQGQSAGKQICTGDLNAPAFTCSNGFITKLSPTGSVVWA